MLRYRFLRYLAAYSHEARKYHLVNYLIPTERAKNNQKCFKPEAFLYLHFLAFLFS